MIPSVQRLLAVFAHPDDESLIVGGTLAACNAAGIECCVLCFTRGEMGSVADSIHLGDESLGAVRERELREACAVLGVSRVHCLSYGDGELYWADRSRMADDLTRVLRAFRPDAVITFGAEGLYWHRDHIAVHEVTHDVVATIWDSSHRPGLYDATWPDTHVAALVSAMEARGLATDLWGLHPSDFGVPAESITTVVDVRPFVRTKLTALQRHCSQLADEHLLRVIPPDLAEAFLGWEYFVEVQPAGCTVDWLHDLTTSARKVSREPIL